ncbi:MAG: O-antigen ligase family protein [Eubacteriales bacterium]|nr:O-antigen ligase family protein [Eubacteriales bacterium]
MMMKTRNKENDIDTIFKNIANGITGVWVFVTLVIFPLYTHEMYFDILGARYNFYKISIIVQASLLLMLALIYIFIDVKERQYEGLIRFKNSFSPKNILKTFRLTDFFLIILLIVFFVSFLGSDYKEEAWTGISGRLQGLECWIYYFISYLLITRTFKFKPFYLDFAILTGCFACVWGILDFYFLDPFGFLREVSFDQKLMFASSIGNYNTYTNYVSIIIAICVTLFCNEKKIWKTIFYGIMLFISITGTVTGISDNAALGLAAIFGFLPFYCFKDRRGFGRYFIFLALTFVSISFVQISCAWHENHFLYSGSIFRTIGEFSKIHYITIIFVINSIALNIYLYLSSKQKIIKTKTNTEVELPLDRKMPRDFFYFWILFFIMTISLVTFVIIDVNGKQKFPIFLKLGINQFLIFNDDWGTHRGHNWRIAVQAFNNFTPFQKLFGHGPDTYLVVTERTAYLEMVQKYGEVYDSAHNEYLHYLVCVGALGLLSYLLVFISGIVRAFKCALDNPYVMACIIAVVAYLVQAIVNIAIPITTPIFFTLFYMAISYMNDMDYKKINKEAK